MAEEEKKKKKCFVVMGFGTKTDYATGRVLDLDKTYRIIIKKAVEEAGLECIRADTVIHSGIIDKPMYELLLDADLVIADLSTSNPNAIYELGVRHALRPYTTIVIAEKQFKFPFDINSLLVRPYEHLGTGIDAEEADKVREELKNAIVALIEKQEVDSPVHVFLPHLVGGKSAAPAAVVAEVAAAVDESAGMLMELFRQARAKENWAGAVDLLNMLLQRRPNDEYLIQQLALATYKGKQPDAETALLNAKKILRQLNPEQTTDPETLGLWGAVHKRLCELKQDESLMDEAIRAHEKGFYLKNDYYNGINLAFLLNTRAAVVKSPREAVADFVTAERVRRRVIEICEAALAKGITDDEGQTDPHERFWVQATLVEAYLGTGEKAKAEALKEKTVEEAPEPWMAGTLNEQLEKLDKLLSIQSSLPV